MESIKLNKNSKEMKTDFNKKATDLAHKLAKSRGYDNAKQLMENTSAQINNKDIVAQSEGLRQARDFTQSLLLLCLNQSIEQFSNLSYMDFVNIFDDGYVNNGNSKEYIATKPTGNDTFIAEKFIPAKVSVKSVEKHIIQMYSSAGTLGTQAYQFKKSLTIQESLWLPYFKSGKLGEFINNLQNQLMDSFKMFKFDKIAKLITGSNTTYAKTITGTAPDMFEAITTELLPNIRNMTLLNSQYNKDSNSKYIQTTDLSDLMVIMSPKNLTTLESGLKTQLFQAKLLNVGSVLDASNIILLGNQLTIGTGDDVISVSDDAYVDDNTVYVISKNAIKHIAQLNRVESQAWAENMTLQYTFHVWGAVDFLPWGQCFKYTNSKFANLPSSVK